MTRRRNQRGFTLSEILVALVLAGMVSVAILMLARGQLRAHEMNDEIMRAQSNVRAGIGYVESILRRSCGGTSSGAIGINVAGAPQTVTTCVKVYDGAIVSSGSFTAGSSAAAASNPDAIEIIYPISSPTVADTDTGTVLTTSPSVHVANTTGFVAGSVTPPGDLVLVSDNSGADLFRLQSITLDTVPAGNPTAPGTLTMYPVTNAASSYTPPGVTLPKDSSVFRATSVSLFLDTTQSYTVPTGYQRTLLLDPNGVAGADHLDAEPLVENVDDLQIAFGVDGFNGAVIDGLIADLPATTTSTDEWVGDVAGELANMPATPWVSTGIHPIAVRATILVRTSDKYVGTPPSLAYEDRSTYPTSLTPGTPRYRAERIVVAPRAWNLGN